MTSPQEDNTDSTLCEAERLRRKINTGETVDLENELLTLLSRIGAICAVKDTIDGPLQLSETWNLLQCVETTPSSSCLLGEKERLVSLIGELLRLGLETDHLSLFEIHATAVQSLVFAQDADFDTVTVCLLLCCFTLRRCPTPIQKRGKRWRSCQLETVRLYQRHFLIADGDEVNSENSETFDLWIKHILPSCRWVQENLSDLSTIHSATWSCLVAGCTSTLAVRAAAQSTTTDEFIDNPMLVLTGALAEDIRFDELAAFRGLRDKGLSGDWMAWSRAETLSFYRGDEVDIDDTVVEELLENVAHVDTAWNLRGISLILAFEFLVHNMGPDCRSPWNALSPYIDDLLQDDGIGGELGFRILEKVLLVTESLFLNKDTSPEGTLQLLGNRILHAANLQYRKSQGHQNTNTQIQHGPRAFTLMKTLLSKCQCVDQVLIVSNLLRVCPHSVLEPKIVDLLRPFVGWNDTTAVSNAWDLVEENINEMERQVQDFGDRSSIAGLSETFMSNVERHLAFLSLIELWIRVRTEPPLLFAQLMVMLASLKVTLEMSSHCDPRLGLMEVTVSTLLEF